MFLCMFWSVEGFLFRFFLHSTNLNHSMYLCRVFQMLTTDLEVLLENLTLYRFKKKPFYKIFNKFFLDSLLLKKNVRKLLILLFNPIRNSQNASDGKKKSTKKEAETWQLCENWTLISPHRARRNELAERLAK